jgi:hypothetical protein
VDKELVTREEAVTVPVATTASVEVCTGTAVLFWAPVGGKVDVPAKDAVGIVVEETLPASGFTKKTDPRANSTITREAASHCRPATIRAWRVR